MVESLPCLGRVGHFEPTKREHREARNLRDIHVCNGRTPTVLVSSRHPHGARAIDDPPLRPLLPSPVLVLSPMLTRSRSKLAKQAVRRVSEVSLSDMPDELHMLIFEQVDGWRDRAAMCVAMPRSGIAAIQSITAYKDPLLAVSMKLMQHRASTLIDEDLLRRYAADDLSTPEGCAWLRAAALQDGSTLHVTVVAGEEPCWRLCQGVAFGAVLRRKISNMLVHYVGELGVERHVRVVSSRGNTHHFEGDKGAERTVRVVSASGAITYLEGDKDAERILRVEHPDGTIHYFEGEMGAERQERVVHAGGASVHFEGDKDAERIVRMVLRGGAILHFEGERGAERHVRTEHPNGDIMHYEGEKDAERMVSAERVVGALLLAAHRPEE